MSMPSWMKREIEKAKATSSTPIDCSADTAKPVAAPCVSPFPKTVADTAKPVADSIAEPVSKIVPTAEVKKPTPTAEPPKKQSEAGVFANSVKNALKNGQGKRMKSRLSK